MVSLEQFHEMLDEEAEELPEELYRGLNGGVILSEACRLSEHARADDLYTMGEYQYSGAMGSRIVIYYGSFQQVYGNCSPEELRRHVREVLRHDFRHHLERQAGVRDLEREDEADIRRYLYGDRRRR